MTNTDSNCLYYLLLQQLTDGIVLMDNEQKIIFANEAAERIRNFDKNAVIGQKIMDCHEQFSRDKVERTIEYLTTHKNKSCHRIVADEGKQKVFDNTFIAIFNEQNAMSGLAVITKDITAQRKAEEASAYFQRAQALTIDHLSTQCNNLVLASMEMLANIIESKDKYIDGHSKRVADIVTKIYEYRFGITETYADIQWAAKLHDIGKVCIPDYILNLPRKLTNEEFDIVKKHCLIGSDIIRKLDQGNRIAPSIRSHHERFDGTGYPDGLVGTNIPLGARMIAIADTYDAMHSDRPYRKALPLERCVKEIRENAGTQFDPEWVEVFIELVETGSVE